MVDSLCINFTKLDSNNVLQMKKQIKYFKIILWIFMSKFITVESSQINYRKLLLDKLFSNYSTSVRPYCGNNDVINTTIDVALRQVIDLDEPTQILKLNIWVRLEWSDCQLVWNPSDFNGINTIGVLFNTIWAPDVTLYDGMSEEFHFNGLEHFRPVINSNGTVSYNFPSITRTRCIVDVMYFPFDSQTCKLVFGSWSHNGNEINFEHKHLKGDLTQAEQKVEFHVYQFPAERHVVYYNCCLEPYPDVTFYLNLERKPMFYVVNLILPTMLITVMAALGFLLPAESGEKVSLEMTVLLSLTVFQLVVADALPSASSIPIIAIFYNMCLFLTAFSSVTAVLVLNVYYRDNNTDIPKYIRKFFLDFAARFVFVKIPSSKEGIEQYSRKKISKKVENNSNKIAPELILQDIGSIANIQQNLESEEQCKNDQGRNRSFIKTPKRSDDQVNNNNTMDMSTKTSEWKVLAKILDRISVVIFLSIFIFGSLAIFCQFIR